MDLAKYLTKKSPLQVGVDVGFAFLKIALLQILPDRIKLLSYRCEDISRFEEEWEKNNFILQQVEDFIKTHGLTDRSIHLNLPLTNAVYTKTIKLPHMPPREIPNAAKWQIKEEVSVNIDETEFAWQYVSPRDKPPKPRIEIVYVAAKRDFLNKYVELFKCSNISLSEITLSPFSINALLPINDLPIAVLDIGYKQSVFSMHAKGKLLFLRPIHVGADNFKTPQPDQLRTNVEHICGEVIRSIRYCELEFTSEVINRIYLTGGGTKVKTLMAQIREVSGLDIRILRFPRNMGIDENIRKDFEAKRDSLQILPAIGAAVTSTSKINILPIEARTEKLLLAQKISFRLLGLTAILILILSSFFVRSNVNIVEKRLNNAMAELAFLREAEALKIEIVEYNKVINQIKAQHIPPEWTLKFISSVIPENMVLNSFIFNNKDKSIDLRGLIYTKGGSAEKTITEFIRNLKQVELFEDARLVSVEKVTRDSFGFNIACNLSI